MTEQATTPAVTEHPCPGPPRCAYPPGHHHLQYCDCCSAVYSADGGLLDPFDLPRTAVWFAPARPRRKKQRKRRR